MRNAESAAESEEKRVAVSAAAVVNIIRSIRSRQALLYQLVVCAVDTISAVGGAVVVGVAG